MQDPSDSTEAAEPEDNGEDRIADSPALNDPAPDEGIAAEPASTILAEVLPGVAVVFGEVPAELEPDLIDFGLVSATDRMQISTVLASIGNSATVAGNLGSALAGARGLYRISEATRALLKAGGTLAVKDGANLGTVLTSNGFRQARFIPVDALSATQTAAALGPALAMFALQMQLNEVTSLVRSNIALTRQVLEQIRRKDWSELTALVATVQRAVDQAREIESVPKSLWENIAGSEASLRTQRELYLQNVRAHIAQIEQAGTSRRREYLQSNAEAIVFDAFALVDAVKAWTGYQGLRAGRARVAGQEDAGEAKLVDVIARDTRVELESAIAETTSLVDSLTRELRIIAELAEPSTLSHSLTGRRKDAKAARQASVRLLEAIAPLADALRPPAPPLEAPGIVCAPETLDLDPYLRILRWLLEDGETLRVLAFPDQIDAPDAISLLLSGAREKLAAAMDKETVKTLVAVTDRRIITAKTNTFVEQGETRLVIPIDQVRYVRVRTAAVRDGGGRLPLDLITRDDNIRWLFQSDIDHSQVDTLAAVLAESMTIPDTERDALRRRGRIAIEESDEVGPRGMMSADQTGSRPTLPDAS